MCAQDVQLLADSRAAEAAGDLAVALRRAGQACVRARARADPDLLAAALCRMAALRWSLGRCAQAYQLAGQALGYAADPQVQVEALIIAGSCAAALDDPAAGAEYLQLARDQSRQIGYRVGHSRALQQLAGLVYLCRGQLDLARTTAIEAARLDPADPQPLTWLICARVYQLAGEPGRAHEALEAAQAAGGHDRRLGALASLLAAQLALDAHDLGRARALLDAALPVAEATGHPWLDVGVRLALSRWHRLRDDGAAIEWACDALVAARRAGPRYLEACGQRARGLALWQARALGPAADDLCAARAAFDAAGALYDAAHAALLCSALYQQIGHAEAAPSWLDAARRIAVGGFTCLLERERELSLPLLAAHARRDDGAAGALLDKLMQLPPPPLAIVGLGEFAVRQGARDIPGHAWEQRRAGELLRFLLLQPRHSACRDQVIEALWPQKPHPAAERLLQQATWALRHVLEPDLPEKFPSRYLTVADRRLTLRLPPGSRVDFVVFEQALAAARAGPREALERALQAYGGPLFADDRYADWSAGPREHLLGLYLRGLLELARRQLDAGCPAQAIACCDRILAQDRWHEEAVRLAMLACLSDNDRPGALRRYEALRHALRRDLRLRPRADLCDLAESIRGDG